MKRKNGTEYEDIAMQVFRFMKDEGAIRYDPNTIGRFFTVPELAEELGFFISEWLAIKETMLRLGINLCWRPGKGHFIGGDGEEVLNLYYCQSFLFGWMKRARAWETSIANRG